MELKYQKIERKGIRENLKKVFLKVQMKSINIFQLKVKNLFNNYLIWQKIDIITNRINLINKLKNKKI